MLLVGVVGTDLLLRRWWSCLIRIHYRLGIVCFALVVWIILILLISICGRLTSHQSRQLLVFLKDINDFFHLVVLLHDVRHTLSQLKQVLFELPLCRAVIKHDKLCHGEATEMYWSFKERAVERALLRGQVWFTFFNCFCFNLIDKWHLVWLHIFHLWNRPLLFYTL